MNILDALSLLLLSMQAIALLGIAMSLSKMRGDKANNHDWSRRVHTLSACKLSASAQDTISFALKEHIPVQEYLENKDLRRKVTLILNEVELLCVGITKGIYDEEIIRFSLENTFMFVFRELSHFIVEYRNSNRNSNLYISFESTVRRWEAMRESNLGIHRINRI